MNLHRLLHAREDDGRPLRVALVGAGKFGSMFLSQARSTPGLRVAAIADLSVPRAMDALRTTGWPADITTTSVAALQQRGDRIVVTDDTDRVLAADGVDIVVDATGSASAGIRHVLACCLHGKSIVMVNVEADALAGPLLARRAQRAGIVYSLAYGDQPALICEMADWARTAGFDVVAAGKGTKYLPSYHASTPDTVWEHYGLSADDAKAGGLNARMFNSFLDGTKSAIEMAAVANATGLVPAPGGLAFPPCSVDDLASVLIPRTHGGQLHHSGQVEVISSLHRDGSPVLRDLRWGVYVTFRAPTAYVERCFREYGLSTDASGRYASMYKPYHLIGLELGVSVASVGLRHEPTGVARSWEGDVVATAKRALRAGETLDGEGGYTVYGALLPAPLSLAHGALPLGLAHGMRVNRNVDAGTTLSWDDVAFDANDPAVAFRREMEREFGVPRQTARFTARREGGR